MGWIAVAWVVFISILFVLVLLPLWAGYLVKGVSPDEIVRAIERVIEDERAVRHVDRRAVPVSHLGPARDSRLHHVLLHVTGNLLTEAGDAPAELRRRVTSAGGTTHAAMEAFEAGGFNALVARAIRAASDRSRQLSADSD